MMQTIQWFPGHMAKAKREIKEKIKLIDLIIELKDARIPYSSTNPMIDEIVGNKPRLILLCKSTMADPVITKKWIDYYKEKGIIALDIDSIAKYNLNKIVPYARLALKDLFEARQRKGIVNQAIKAVILGIPNVGKSTLINALAKRKAVAVGNKPGVTKNQTWIRISEDLQLLDTPGILWPKFEDQTVGLRLAMCGCIKDDILDLEEITLAAINYVKDYYPQNITKRYGIEKLSDDPREILEEICKIRGYLLKGGACNYLQATVAFMNELRSVKLGRMSYEQPERSN